MSREKAPNNPFFTGINIPDRYFCDREMETKDIINQLKNDNNLVIKAPRRVGKSSLIMHVFQQKEVKDTYNTLYVDIYGTKNMDDLVKEFMNAFLEAGFARSVRGKKQVEGFLQRLYLQANLSPGGEVSAFRLGLTPSNGVNFTLSEMFRFLEHTKKPNLVVFDEFQKVKEYPDDITAELRSHIQRMTNTRFIFSGSSRHMLHNMFEHPKEPFYRSASSMNLDIISEEVYTTFARRLFQQYRKDISDEAVALVYALFSGRTYDMQEVMKEVFQQLDPGKTAVPDNVKDAVTRLIAMWENDFRERMDKIEKIKNRNMLYAVALEGIATSVTSTAFIRKYKMDNASSVQNAIAYLSDDSVNAIEKIGKASYQLQNRLFEFWIAKGFRRLDQKFDMARERYNQERQMLAQQPTFEFLG